MNATEQEVIEAAKKAHAHEFIMSLPDKYNTVVGEKGISLSGGQRQRIAIARALLKNSPIILLDEATAFLDSESEKIITEVINTQLSDKTVLVVAHRLSTIKDSDVIMVVEDGRIVESGSHDELMYLDGRYAYLFKKQFSEVSN